MSHRRFSILLTATQAAERLGIPVERVLLWAAEGRLRIAGQDEDGRALFREHIIDTIGEDLVALTPPAERRPRKLRPARNGREHTRPSHCGCNPARSPLHLCPTGAALNAALQLAESLAAAIPSDALLRKLAALCHDALARHLAGPRLTPPLPTGVEEAITRLEARTPTDSAPDIEERAKPMGLIPRSALAPANETAGHEVHVT